MQVNKRESMYALLVAVAAVIGITIYGSCSADEDFDYYSGHELSTRAEREMGRGENIVFHRLILPKGSDNCTVSDIDGLGSFSITLNFSWKDSEADNAVASATVDQIENKDTSVYKRISCQESPCVHLKRRSIAYPDSTSSFEYSPLIQGEKIIYNSYGDSIGKELINVYVQFNLDVTTRTHWEHYSSH